MSLLAACEEGQKQVASALAGADYAAAVSALSQLREPIDIFFDKVLVWMKMIPFAEIVCVF